MQANNFLFPVCHIQTKLKALATQGCAQKNSVGGSCGFHLKFRSLNGLSWVHRMTGEDSYHNYILIPNFSIIKYDAIHM